MVETNARRGIKRKRTNSGQHERSTDDVSRINAKIHHCLIELRRVSKKIRTFETQKLVKRLKTFRQDDNKGDQLQNAEQQLVWLKHTNHDRIALMALKSKIKKDHQLSENSMLAQSLANEMKFISSSNPSEEQKWERSTTVVESRLLSSKVLAQATSSVLQSLKVELGLATVDKSKTNSGTRYGVAASSSIGDSVEDNDNNSQANQASHSDVDSEEAADDAGWESGSISGTVELQSKVNEEERGSDDSEKDASASFEKPKVPRSTKPGKGISVTSLKSSAANTAESTFLPSLSVGYIRGDSDASDFSGDDIEGPQRKNRRGQRARKAIWEKKYGKNANHVKKQREERQAIFEAKAARRAAVSATRRGQQLTQTSAYERGIGRGDGAFHSSSNHADNDRRDDWAGHAPRGNFNQSLSGRSTQGVRESRNEGSRESKPLHPSWEAKRKLKEKQNMTILPPQGTRIKFD